MIPGTPTDKIISLAVAVVVKKKQRKVVIKQGFTFEPVKLDHFRFIQYFLFIKLYFIHFYVKSN